MKKSVLQIKTKNRQSNFELLRIIAMLMIVAHHLVVHGVTQVSYSSGTFVNKIFASFLQPFGQIGVALFFMISGFFLCQKEKVSVKKVALEAAFYSFALGIAFIILLIIGKTVGGEMLV